jgi:hypothetical protein
MWRVMEIHKVVRAGRSEGRRKGNRGGVISGQWLVVSGEDEEEEEEEDEDEDEEGEEAIEVGRKIGGRKIGEAVGIG